LRLQTGPDILPVRVLNGTGGQYVLWPKVPDDADTPISDVQASLAYAEYQVNVESFELFLFDYS